MTELKNVFEQASADIQRKQYGFHIDPAAYESKFVKTIPALNGTNLQLNPFEFTIANVDARDVDLSNAGETIKYITYDNYSKFPNATKLPTNFNPEKILEQSKDPGLNIKALHRRGITGRGITVAIIDTPLNPEHIEYKDNLLHYENINYPEKAAADMHGCAVASILVGKTTGVAPEAKLIFFARDNTKGQENETPVHPMNSEQMYTSSTKQALQKILEMNTRLPNGKKISIVSISSGILNFDNDGQRLIQELQDSGVFVLDVGRKRHKLNFITTDKIMNSDVNNPQSYGPGFWRDRPQNPEHTNNLLLVPAGGRTTAGPCGKDHYVYYGDGGMSWATPYLAGVFALARQVNQQITPAHFFELALKTATPLKQEHKVLGKIIQPEKIIHEIEREIILTYQNTHDVEK